jgi:hypothetical protein
VLSDVTIRYGASGELKFKAHRLLLSAQSRWFEAAFTGGFAVSPVPHNTVHAFNEVHRRAMPERSLWLEMIPMLSKLCSASRMINRFIHRRARRMVLPSTSSASLSFIAWATSTNFPLSWSRLPHSSRVAWMPG